MNAPNDPAHVWLDDALCVVAGDDVTIRLFDGDLQVDTWTLPVLSDGTVVGAETLPGGRRLLYSDDDMPHLGIIRAGPITPASSGRAALRRPE